MNKHRYWYADIARASSIRRADFARPVYRQTNYVNPDTLRKVNAVLAGLVAAASLLAFAV